MSLQRILEASSTVEPTWVGPKQAAKLTVDEATAYKHAHTILCHLAVRGPRAHHSGHPGGPLSAFTFAYCLSKLRDSAVDQPLRFSAGHVSLLAYGLQYLFGREGRDKRLQSPQAIIDHFRIPSGLPGHVEAGIGDIPFGTGPLGKGVSNALGAVFGLKLQKKPGRVDVLMADGDSQEGQIMEAFRLAAHLRLDNLFVHGDINDVQLSGIPSRTVAADIARIAAACGWRVIEVQNGNDPGQVKAAIQLANTFTGEGRPIFLCYYTTMGHGVAVMEEGSNSTQKNYHGAPLSDDEAKRALAELPDFDEAIKAYEPFRKEEKKRYAKGHVETDMSLNVNMKGYKRAVTKEKGAARKDFGATHLKNLMAADPRIIVLHADLAGSGGFDVVEKVFPERVINVGVAEANMYMMAAGMRQVGLLPVTYTFAAFGVNEARANARLIDINCGHTRCAILHDCTHAGSSVGEDGETHQEQNYLTIPFRHTQVWVPGDSNQAAAMAEKGLELIAEGHTNVYVFSGRSGHPQLLTPDGDVLYGTEYQFDGRAELVRGRGNLEDRLTILCSGSALHDAVAAADALAKQEPPISVRVLNVACVRPIDASAVFQAALETTHLIVVEDHNVEGGLATQVADVIADFSLPCSLRRLGLRHYLPSGTAEDLKVIAGLDQDSIMDAIEDEIRTEVRGGEDALVTVIYDLVHHSGFSRFSDQVQEFKRRLISEKGYLEALRTLWSKRGLTPEKLPSNAELREKLEG